MLIKADRDVLYFEKTNNISNNRKKINILHNAKETPPHVKYQDRGYPCLLFEDGSLTVEAAFSGTAFFLVLFSLLYLFWMLFGICKVQMRLASAVEQYECFGTKLGTVECALKQSAFIQWDEQKGICYVKERKEIPFLGGRFFGVSLYQQMKIHSYEGRSMVSSEEVSEEYVYIAESGRVYHLDRGCVYLNPGIESMRYYRVDSQRNRSGGKYESCKSCCRYIVFTEETIVYLTPYGDCFHISRQCSGLKRTIRRVLLSETGNMPPCSKCAKDR